MGGGRAQDAMTDRRHFLGLCLTAAAGLAGRSASAATVEPPVISEDGLYTQSWFLQSFLDLAEDLGEAAAEGKRFAIIWEQKGCPYCRETHLVNFADPEIQTFVRENFNVLQLDLFGSREVTDFDGEAMEERRLARKYGIAFTPTVQFFPDDPAALEGKRSKDREVARMPGYLRPPHFLSMFKYVEARAYEKMGFRAYLKAGS